MTPIDDERELRRILSGQRVTEAEVRAAQRARSRIASLSVRSGRARSRLHSALALVALVAVLGAVAALAIAIHVGSRGTGKVPSGSTTPSPSAISRPSSSPSPSSRPSPSASISASASAWRVVSTPGGLDLSSVSCVSSTDCWAVGNTTIEHYEGSAWTVVSNPTGGGLVSVACPAANDCWAVGGVNALGGNAVAPLIAHYTGGAWAIASGPSVSPVVDNDLVSFRAVTCVSADDCWAVGTDSQDLNGPGGGPPAQPLIAHYDGAAWELVTAPAAGTDNSTLAGVACATSTDCWAVGTYSGGALIEHYAGSAWTVAGGGVDGLLDAVTCAGPEECWAVGPTGGAAGNQPLVEEYRGSGWAAVSSPPVAGSSAQFFGVACVAADDCWAVGEAMGAAWVPGSGAPPPGVLSPLVEHYSAGIWTVVTSSQVGYASLSAITAVSPGTVWAVGGVGYPMVALTETTP
jgi:hypothetical protein